MIEIRNLRKTFDTADSAVNALNNINLTVNDGDIYGIIGMSGAGKSTLVRCINMLERPTSGSVIIDGVDMCTLNKKQLRDARKDISMIFQGFNLLMQRTCLANICFPMELAGVKKEDAVKEAKKLLELVGLPNKADEYPSKLSGGQQQRIAIARALASKPKVLLCDEATSALDPKTTRAILELIRDINKRMGITVIIITHQMSVVEEICNRVAILDSGEVAEEGDVAKIFAQPKSPITKRMVYPQFCDDKLHESIGSQRVISLLFDGSSATNSPIIASMAMEENIASNILYASTRLIDGKIYGSMMLGLEDNDDTVARAIKYISEKGDIKAEEVEYNAE